MTTSEMPMAIDGRSIGDDPEPHDPAATAADAVRERLAAVEMAYRKATPTVGPFVDPDAVYMSTAGRLDSLMTGYVKIL
jgi:hypothetical protein